jgi:hypothetical protein
MTGKNRRWLHALILSMLPLAPMQPAAADDLEELRKLRDTTINLVNALVDQGVLTRAKADELIRQAQQAAQNSSTTGGPVAAPNGAGATVPPSGGPSAPAPVQPGVVRVPYVPESVKEEIRDEVKQDVLTQAKSERWGDPGAMPDWVHRITWSGDVRFRFEADRFPTDGGVPNASPEQLAIPEFGAWPEANTTDPMDRMRIRARLGLTAELGNTVTVGIRLASGGVGSGSNPSTENQTLGNYNTHESVGFDRAYLDYHPWAWLNIDGGRMGQPFFAPTTLVWANDLSLEGISGSLTPQFFGDRLGFFINAGAFPILDNDPTPLSSSSSKWLYAWQAGIKLGLPKDSSFRIGAALYDYRNIEGILNPTYYSTIYSGTAAPFRQGGNSVFDINGYANTLNGTQDYLIGLASQFHEANASSALDLGFGYRTHVMLNMDYVKNLGFNHQEILDRTGQAFPERTTGAQVQLAVGDPDFTRRYSWRALVGYRYVQSDAVVDAFTDSDFHLGGTNAEGYILGGEFAFERNATLRVRWMSGKQIDGLPLAINVLQVDATGSF